MADGWLIPLSPSPRHDHARAGIAAYWIIDLEPKPRIQPHVLDGGSYRPGAAVGAGVLFAHDTPFPVSFDPARLLDPDELW